MEQEQQIYALDELVEDEEATVDDSTSQMTLGNRKVFSEKLDPPVKSLYEDHKTGDLKLNPTFQRRVVWDDQRCSRLVESVILEVPLPVFYVAESFDGTREVIDGQQRLTALFRFLDNSYALKGLSALPALNGKLFADLDKPTQKLIRNCSLRVVVFKKESDENLRFDIFARLNTGAVPLNDQEIRNCIYRGPYNDLLHELAAEKEYMKLMGMAAPEKRMKDVEYVLRFAAFYHATYLKYKPPMSVFLNNDMLSNQRISAQAANKLRLAFKNSVYLIVAMLGPNAFRRFYRGDDKKPDGYWEPKKFNASLYDILMVNFADRDKNLIMANPDTIREAYIALMTNDEEFINSIELSTSSIRMVIQRFDKWRLTLDGILANQVKQPRCFSQALKKQLYDANATCRICSQHISHIDDAAVDHIEQYWMGGQTIPENARLAHRFCNWSRPRKGTS